MLHCMKEQTAPSSRLWRLIKVLYFLITIPFLLFLMTLLLGDPIYISRWETYVRDQFIFIAYILLYVWGYILFTDLLRRIARYINNGSFIWFINYKKLFTTLIWIPIWIIILFVGLFTLSDEKRNQCSWPYEQYTEEGVCGCESWYERAWEVCEITIGKKIYDLLPPWSYPREIQEIPWELESYIGLYIVNQQSEQELKDKFEEAERDDSFFANCFWEVEGVGVKWDYYLFSYVNWKITNKIPVPLWFREGLWGKLSFPLANTKQNNHNFYHWPKPLNNEDWKTIEPTQLIHLKDYNGDWIPYEFLLFDHRDQVCWHNNYLVAWYESSKKEVVIYWIEQEDWTIWYRGDNFIPDSRWEVINWRLCWDHGAWTELQKYYKFNKEKNLYEFLRKIERECKENEFR